MEAKKRYTIGEISKICNISPEQLRHYDREHILSPSVRGSENHYRYYTEAQIDDILLLKELKQVGLPLKSIAVLLKDKSLAAIKAVLEKSMLEKRRELYEKQKSYDQLVDVLLRLNNAIQLISQSREEGQDFGSGFSIVPIAERPIVFTRHPNRLSVTESFISRYTELLNLIEKEKLETSTSIYLLFHDHYSKQFAAGHSGVGDLEVFSNLTGSAAPTPYCRVFGGFLAACVTHIGHYRDTQKPYEALERWAIEQGYSVSGISFQELIVGRTLTSCEENFVTKIYLPLNIADI